MSNKSEIVQANWEGFNKYVGIQGLMGMILLLGFVYASLTSIQLPDLYTNVMTLVIGYFFAKNGVGILSSVKGVIEAQKGK